MKNFFLVAVFFSILLNSNLVKAQPGTKCNVVEYAELKDMSTSFLVLEIAQNFRYYELLKISLKVANTSELAKYKDEIDICKRQAERMAAIANKRKDFNRIEPAYCKDECRKFSTLRMSQRDKKN